MDPMNLARTVLASLAALLLATACSSSEPPPTEPGPAPSGVQLSQEKVDAVFTDESGAALGELYHARVPSPADEAALALYWALLVQAEATGQVNAAPLEALQSRLAALGSSYPSLHATSAAHAQGLVAVQTFTCEQSCLPGWQLGLTVARNFAADALADGMRIVEMVPGVSNGEVPDAATLERALPEEQRKPFLKKVADNLIQAAALTKAAAYVATKFGLAISTAELIPVVALAGAFRAGFTVGTALNKALDYWGTCKAWQAEQCRVSSVKVAPASVQLSFGSTSALQAQLFDSAGQRVTAPSPVQWLSADPSVATVNGTTGVVTPVGYGTTSISASVSGKTGTASVTLEPLAVTLTAPSTTLTGTRSVSADGTTGTLRCSMPTELVATGGGRGTGEWLNWSFSSEGHNESSRDPLGEQFLRGTHPIPGSYYRYASEGGQPVYIPFSVTFTVTWVDDVTGVQHVSNPVTLQCE